MTMPVSAHRPTDLLRMKTRQDIEEEIARRLAAERARLEQQNGIRETAKFDDDTAAALESAYESFLEQFETSEGGRITVGHEEFEALDDEDVEQDDTISGVLSVQLDY